MYHSPDEKAFDEKCAEMLNLVLAECARQFERLPCVEDAEILRNILYAGVWEKSIKNRKKARNKTGESIMEGQITAEAIMRAQTFRMCECTSMPEDFTKH